MTEVHNPFPPGVAEAMAEGGADMTDVLPSKEPPTIKPIARHSVQYLAGGRPRFAIVELDCPLSFDGKEFRTISVRRLTVGEVGSYIDRLAELRKSGDDTTVVPFPVYCDDEGNDLPDGLLEVLVDDDMTKLSEAAESFLPRRFRIGEREAEASASAERSTGDTSASS